MKFCPQCAGDIEFRIVEQDDIPRYVCRSCGAIHYQNPKIVVGTLPLWNNKVLLCKRNIEPAYGLWTLPAGYMELNETVIEGAIRETLEETGATVTNLKPYALYDIVHIGQVYLMFLAELTAPNFHPTAESMEVQLFTVAAIPWNDLAFPVVRKTLEHYRENYRTGSFSFAVGQITERMHHHR